MSEKVPGGWESRSGTGRQAESEELLDNLGDIRQKIEYTLSQSSYLGSVGSIPRKEFKDAAEKFLEEIDRISKNLDAEKLKPF